ncbi:flippase [Thermodesulforhabdus norvegica]|uniref:Membrane protein involved in the export of O-antigen and teichoic acid n=1 Tax=Thermodesulforhabdus norvegica TaxID=39841 RepID=A0A1I4V6I5_9BACT|nr:flippase [Thermodesulforhabdus norvegica]SFM96788.1 Membrane protein involved in the export of O-antigen and teichoic acid [Thermodesulforhabdus norvegica]
MRSALQTGDLFNFIFSLSAQSIGRAVSIGSNIVVFLLVARILGADTLGQFAYFVTYASLLATLVDFGTGETAAKDLASLPEELRPAYWGNFLSLRVVLSILGVVIGIFLGGLLRQDIRRELIVASLSVPFVASRIFDPLYQIFGRPWYSSIASGAFGLFYLGASGFVFSLKKPGTFELAMAFLTAHVLYALVASLLALNLLKPRFSLNRVLLKKNLRIAVPLGISSIFTMINSRADTFMLAWLKGDRDVGLYNAAYKLVDIAATVVIVCTTPALPIVSRVASENSRKFAGLSRKIFSLMLIFLGPFALLTPLFSDPLMRWLYGDEFAPAATALNILAWVCLLVCFSVVSSMLCLTLDLVHFAWWSSALAALLNIFLNYHWIPEYGIIGSSWATLLCEILLLGITVGYLSEKERGTVPWSFFALYTPAMGLSWLIIYKLLHFPERMTILTVALKSGLCYFALVGVGFLCRRLVSAEGEKQKI